MLKRILASTALASVLATGAYAQTATDPAVDEPTAPAAEGAAPPVVMPEAEGTAADPATAEDPAVAEDPAATTPAPTATAPALEEGWVLVDAAKISADSLVGADIQNAEMETVATVEDVILDPDGAVENVVAQFGGVLGFGGDKVLLTMDEIEVLEDPNQNIVVRTSLTPEALEGRPPYEEG